MKPKCPRKTQVFTQTKDHGKSTGVKKVDMDLTRINSGNSSQNQMFANNRKIEKKDTRTTDLNSLKNAPTRNLSRSLLTGLLKFNNKVEIEQAQVPFNEMSPASKQERVKHLWSIARKQIY